jgi:hypothetical protein
MEVGQLSKRFVLKPKPRWWKLYVSSVIVSLKSECTCQGLQFLYSLGFEVLAVVNMKSTLFWDVMPHSLLEVHWHLRRMYCFHLQGWKITLLAACFLLVSCLVYSSTLKILDCGGSIFLWNVRLLRTTQHLIKEVWTFSSSLPTCRACAKFSLESVLRVGG